MSARARSAALVLIVAAGLGLCGCDDGGARGDARQGGSVVVAQAAPPGSLDPALVSTAAARRLAWLAYTPPLTYRRVAGADGTGLAPALSEDLPETSEDGRTYTLTFRRGLRYSDGRALRASDLERAIARSLRLNPSASAVYRGIVGARAYAAGKAPGADIRGIVADEAARSVRIELETADRLFPYALASTLAAPVPGGTPMRDLSTRPPAGIGPYRVSQVRRSGDVVLERRRGWRLAAVPPGHAQEIVTRTIPDRAARVRAVLNGRADLVEGEAPEALLPEIRSTYAGRYEEHPTLRSLYVLMDARREPFRDGEARRALSFALDTRVLSRLYHGFLTPSCNVLPSQLPGYRRLDPCPYGDRDGDADLVRASGLVEKAGARGAVVRLRRGTDARSRSLARYLRATMEKVGFEVRLVSGPGAQVRVAAAEPDVPHPAGYLRAVDDPVLRARVNLLAQESDPTDAERDWADVDREVVNRAYMAPYGVETTGVLASERLDMENCARFHAVAGMDYSSVCIR